MLRNLTRNIRWNFALFFTKHQNFFFVVVLFFCFTIPEIFLASIKNFAVNMLLTILIILPLMILANEVNDLILFKFMGFTIHKISVKDIFVNWKKTIKSIENYLNENEIPYYMKDDNGRWDDIKIVFKNTEDFNFLRITFENDSFPSKP